MGVVVLILAADLAICAGAIALGGDDPHRHFREFAFVTWLNAGQLLACAAVAAATYARRADQPGAEPVVWLCLSGATAFLALDEVFSLSRTDGVILTFLRQDLGLPIGMELQLGSLGAIRWGDVLQGAYAATVMAVCLRYRSELLRLPSVVTVFGLGAALLAGALYIDAGPSHAQFLLPGVDRLGPMLEPLQDTLKLTGFGAVLGAFVLAHRYADTAPAKRELGAHGKLSSTPSR